MLKYDSFIFNEKGYMLKATNIKTKRCTALQEEKAAEEMIATMNEGVVDMLEYKDDGYIELIFKLLARICDGQHFGLQVRNLNKCTYTYMYM